MKSVYFGYQNKLAIMDIFRMEKDPLVTDYYILISLLIIHAFTN